MTSTANPSVSRRRFLKTAGATALAASAGPAIIIPGRAQPKTLKILDHVAFSPLGNQLFDEFCQTWGEQHGIQVIVDRLRQIEQLSRIDAEAEAQQGHDLVLSPIALPAVLYEDQVIDHRELYQECARRYGPAHELAIKSTYNPKTQKYFALAIGHEPFLVVYRQDLWQAVGRTPDTWDNVRLGGRHIKLVHDPYVGISLIADRGLNLDSNIALGALLYAFGGSEQDTDGRPALKSPQTLEALKFFKALYFEAMTAEVLSWDNTSNNRAMLAGECSLTLNPTTVTRAGERLGLPVTDHLWLAPPPQGPARRLAPIGVLDSFSIWNFAENIDAAKQFVVDRIGALRNHLIGIGVPEFLPFFPKLIPDQAQLLAHDPQATPPDKYKMLLDASAWTTNRGYPGYLNAAIEEIYSRGLLPRMFAAVATDKMTPEEALTQADQEVRKIYQKWQDAGKI